MTAVARFMAPVLVLSDVGYEAENRSHGGYGQLLLLLMLSLMLFDGQPRGAFASRRAWTDGRCLSNSMV